MKRSLQNREIVLFATIFSIILTTMTYLISSYDKLWLSIEIITLPVIYALGYEHIIVRQKQGFEKTMTRIITETSQLLAKLEKAKKEIATLKKTK